MSDIEKIVMNIDIKMNRINFLSILPDCAWMSKAKRFIVFLKCVLLVHIFECSYYKFCNIFLMNFHEFYKYIKDKYIPI